MANKDYNFQYTPLTGRLPGNSFVKQTEQAINELAGIVNEGAAQVEVITNLANQANDNSEVALEKATEALETSGRVYITLPNLDDADDYYDSQLYYFANSYSANLPVQDTGFLEVKTNDTKTACEQVFVADDTGLCYFRHGVITATEVGEETVYSVTWETWSSVLASEDYVQDELLNYLPLSGGTMTGNLILSNGGNALSDATVGNIVSDSLASSVTGNANQEKTICSVNLAKGVWVVTGHIKFTGTVASRLYGLSLSEIANNVSSATDGSMFVQSSVQNNLVLEVVRIISMANSGLFYLNAYSEYSYTVANADIKAVRII